MSRHRHQSKWSDPKLHRDPDLWDVDALPGRSGKSGSDKKKGGCSALVVALIVFGVVLALGATSGWWL